MKVKITIAALLLSFFYLGSVAQLPLVYNVENTGAAFGPPPLPGFDALPTVAPLTDPFMWSDGSGRSLSFSDWQRRRNEIKAEIEHYEIGTKPVRPSDITASWIPGATPTTGTLRVIVTVNGQTLTLNSAVTLPSGTGPFPAIIGMNSASGSIPADIFTSRNIARITFSHNQVTTYGNPQLTNPYYVLYPDQNLDNAGQYSAWSWGVSRLIDGLELVQASLPIDLTHIGVTGCSYAGKMALFSGALDERIALTIAQESGGGGAPAWRVSETLGDVEKLGSTDHRWFKESMFQFSGSNVSKLPHDHHELMAMIAPRALLVTGNTDFLWLANPSAYVSARAAHEVYKAFGIADRFGFYIDGGHNHCAIPVSQRPAIEAFVEKFLKGNAAANTNVMVHPYPDVDYQRWINWWGSANPVFPPEAPSIKWWMEAECATVGADWDILPDPLASNGSYVMGRLGLNSTATAPAAPAGVVTFTFNIDSAANYNIRARVNCPTANDDSYWVKIDNGAFVTVNNLVTSGWMWVTLSNATALTVGPHTITIGYREDGAKLDKILITTSGATVEGIGTQGSNCGVAPSLLPGQQFSISETALNNSLIGMLLATDPDANTTFHNWRITGGTGTAAFALNLNTGALTVKDSSLFNFETGPLSYSLMVTVTDGFNRSTAQAVTIMLTNANDNAPVISAASFALDGGSCSQLGMVTATDADNINAPGFTTFQNWQITGGTGAGIFAIDPATGMISIANLQHIDLLNSSYTFLVTVSDGLHTSEAQTITVTIPKKITVCHKGQLISVSKMAAIGHLQHGDCIGSCEPQALSAARMATTPGAETQFNSISVYPNPVTDKINIYLGENSNKIRNIQVLDISGRVVLQVATRNASVITIPAHTLSRGSYLVRMLGDTIVTSKVIVQ